MSQTQLIGFLIVVLSGLIMGTSPWPLKLMRQFKYEQFGFISMFVALFLIPWSITLASCPKPFLVFTEVPLGLLIKGNLFSLGWGIAQVLAMLCFMRIGVSLTYGILCSVGAAVGVITPIIFKASGIFSEAPDIFSRGGLTMIFGVVVIIAGVYFASLAGFGREKQINQGQEKTAENKKGGFAIGLVMVLVAGILSAGWGFAFSYTQDTIVDVMTANGATSFAANIAVWAFVLMGAGIVNVLYPAFLMTKNKSWSTLPNGKELMLSVVYGILFFAPSALLGKGMLMLGALGASVGWGVVQGTLILGGQMLGFVSHEWRGVTGRPRTHIYTAIFILIMAIVIMAIGNSLT
jgi:hypothetical protein